MDWNLIVYVVVVFFLVCLGIYAIGVSLNEINKK